MIKFIDTCTVITQINTARGLEQKAALVTPDSIKTWIQNPGAGVTYQAVQQSLIDNNARLNVMRTNSANLQITPEQREAFEGCITSAQAAITKALAALNSPESFNWHNAYSLRPLSRPSNPIAAYRA